MDLPLGDVRVIDLTIARAGPTCVRQLADWGADVIRVEPPGGSDPLGGDRHGSDFQQVHRNKRALSLNLKSPAGVDVLMRLVEVVRGLQTSDSTVAAAQQFAQALGKETVVCEKDSPGFLTSRISAIVRLECLRMLEEGVGTAEDIDRALRLGLNFPIGPLELGDRNGLDTFLLVLESLSQTLGERFRPTVGLRNLVAAGRLGCKTGHGIYDYDERGAIRLPSPS